MVKRILYYYQTVDETPPVDKTVDETPPFDEKTKEDEIQEDETGKDDSKIIEDKTIHEETTQKYNRYNNIIIYILCVVVVAFISISIKIFLKK